MWEFSNLNSGNTLWPPDNDQHHNSVNPNGPSLGFGIQDSFLHLNSSFYPPVNRVIRSSEEEVVNQTKRFLIFDHSRDQTSLFFSSVANPFEGLNRPQPLSCAHDSNFHVIEEEEMHEDTEEIDALLYSDYENMDDEETSTGHSPFDIAEEDVMSSNFRSKRRRVNSTELDASLIDTASSAISPHTCHMQEDYDFDRSVDPDCGRSRSNCDKQEKIQDTLRMRKGY